MIIWLLRWSCDYWDDHVTTEEMVMLSLTFDEATIVDWTQEQSVQEDDEKLSHLHGNKKLRERHIPNKLYTENSTQ